MASGDVDTWSNHPKCGCHFRCCRVLLSNFDKAPQVSFCFPTILWFVVQCIYLKTWIQVTAFLPQCIAHGTSCFYRLESMVSSSTLESTNTDVRWIPVLTFLDRPTLHLISYWCSFSTLCKHSSPCTRVSSHLQVITGRSPTFSSPCT